MPITCNCVCSPVCRWGPHSQWPTAPRSAGWSEACLHHCCDTAEPLLSLHAVNRNIPFAQNNNGGTVNRNIPFAQKQQQWSSQLSMEAWMSAQSSQLSMKACMDVCTVQSTEYEGMAVCMGQLTEYEGMDICMGQLIQYEGMDVCTVQSNEYEGMDVCPVQSTEYEGMHGCLHGPVDSVWRHGCMHGPVDSVQRQCLSALQTCSYAHHKTYNVRCTRFQLTKNDIMDVSTIGQLKHLTRWIPSNAPEWHRCDHCRPASADYRMNHFGHTCFGQLTTVAQMPPLENDSSTLHNQ